MKKCRISVTERDPHGPYGLESILNDTAKHLVAYAFDTSLIQTEDELGCGCYENVDEYVYISPHAYIIRKPAAKRTYKYKLYKKKVDDAQYRQNSSQGGINREYKQKEYKKKFDYAQYRQNSRQDGINKGYKQKEYKKTFDDNRQNVVQDGWDYGIERECKQKEYKKKYDDAQYRQNVVQDGRDDDTNREYKHKEYKKKYDDVQYGRDQTSHIHQDEKPSGSRDYDKSSLCESLAIIRSANMLARWAIDTSEKELKMLLERECADINLRNIAKVTKERLAKEVAVSHDRGKKAMNQHGGIKKESFAKTNRVREPDSAAYEIEAIKLVQIVIDTVLSEMESECLGKERDYLAHRVSGYDSVIAAQALWLVEDVMAKATLEMQDELNSLQQHITETQRKSDVNENELSKQVGKIVKTAIKNAIFEIENVDFKCTEWSTQDKDSRKMQKSEMINYTAADLARRAIRESISDIARGIRQSAQKTSVETTDVHQLPVLKKEDDDRKSDKSITSYSTEASTSSYRSYGKQAQTARSVKQDRPSMYKHQPPATLKNYAQQREDKDLNKTSVSASVSKSRRASDEDSFTSKPTLEPYESNLYPLLTEKQLLRQNEGRDSIGFDYAPQVREATDRATKTVEKRRDVRELSRPLGRLGVDSPSKATSQPKSGEYIKIGYLPDGKMETFQKKSASCDSTHTQFYYSDSEDGIQKSASYDPKYGKAEPSKKEADMKHKALNRTTALTDVRRLYSDYSNTERDQIQEAFQHTKSFDSKPSTSGYSKTKTQSIPMPLHQKSASCDSTHTTFYYSDSDDRIQKSASYDPKYGKAEPSKKEADINHKALNRTTALTDVRRLYSDYSNTERDEIQGAFQPMSVPYDSKPSTSGYSKTKKDSIPIPLHQKSASCDSKHTKFYYSDSEDRIQKSVSFDPKYGKAEPPDQEIDINHKVLHRTTNLMDVRQLNSDYSNTERDSIRKSFEQTSASFDSKHSTSYYSSKETGYIQKTISYNPKFEKSEYSKNETDTIQKKFEQTSESLDSSQITSDYPKIEVNTFHKPFQQRSVSFDSRRSSKEADGVQKSKSLDSKHVTSDFYSPSIEENILLQKLLAETETGRSATEQVFQKLLDNAICHRASLIAKKALVSSLLETHMEERIQYGLLVLNIKYALNLKISECAISAETLARDARNFANELFYAIPDKTTKNVLRVRGETIRGFDVKLNLAKLRI